MTQHTPGPWGYSIEPRSGAINVYADDGNCSIAAVDTENVDERKYAEADARLIAAAPELLEALEDLVCHKYDLGLVSVATLETLQEIRTAIAKAETP